MNSPEEKAKQLVDGFNVVYPHKGMSKNAAILCIDEILKADPDSPYNGSYYVVPSDRTDEVKKYWQKVKEEIQKL